MNKFLNRGQELVEWLLGTIFLLGGISTATAPPLTATGALTAIFGGPVALAIYAVWFGLLGIGLLYCKIYRKKKRLHKNILMAMYLTTIYTFTLSLAIYGLEWSLIDDVVVGVLAAICWMRWTIRTEYLTADAFHKSILKFRDDGTSFFHAYKNS